MDIICFPNFLFYLVYHKTFLKMKMYYVSYFLHFDG